MATLRLLRRIGAATSCAAVIAGCGDSTEQPAVRTLSSDPFERLSLTDNKSDVRAQVKVEPDKKRHLDSGECWLWNKRPDWRLTDGVRYQVCFDSEGTVTGASRVERGGNTVAVEPIQ